MNNSLDKLAHGNYQSYEFRRNTVGRTAKIKILPMLNREAICNCSLRNYGTLIAPNQISKMMISDLVYRNLIAPF